MSQLIWRLGLLGLAFQGNLVCSFILFYQYILVFIKILISVFKDFEEYSSDLVVLFLTPDIKCPSCPLSPSLWKQKKYNKVES